MQWLMLQQEKPNDFVIATGQQISVRDFLERVFKLLGIRIEWRGKGVQEVGVWVDDTQNSKKEKIIVKIDSEYFRPTEVETLLGDVNKAQKELGWKPKVTIDELISEMVESDEQLAIEELTLIKSRSPGDKKNV
jgi:GDPmannose 4,6-dehydratase